jgi:t-SNARE complex subunit (syntaxin)
VLQVKGAAQYIEDGTGQVQQAIEKANSARKTQCCLLICVMIIVGILVLVIFVFRKNIKLF